MAARARSRSASATSRTSPTRRRSSACRTARSPRTSARTSTIKTSDYNSGTDETTALLAGALDAAFVGPNPAINAYQKSGGSLIRIVSGTAFGGAFLVVKPSIKSAADLKGKKLATPSLGNTQDVALRTWLKSKGLSTDHDRRRRRVDRARRTTPPPSPRSRPARSTARGCPSPTRPSCRRRAASILVNEADLWPQGKFVTTNLVVTTKFLADHPDIVSNLLKGLSSSIDLIKSDPTQAEKLVSEGVKAASGKSLDVSLVASSFKSITFTLDPIASSLQKDAQSAKALGFIKSTDLKNIYDLTLLNKLLTPQGKPAITP